MPDFLANVSEGSRVGLVANILGVASDELTRVYCQVKSFLTDRPSLMTSLKARIGGGFDDEGRAMRALFVMVKGAMGGAMIYFSSGLGSAIALALAEIGIVASAPFLAILLVIIGAVLLLGSLSEIGPAIAALRQLDFNAL